MILIKNSKNMSEINKKTNKKSHYQTILKGELTNILNN